MPSNEAPPPHQRATRVDEVPAYEHLPKRVKDNISAQQWPEAEHEIVHPGATIPDTGQYINLKNGLVAQYVVGETANAPLLPVHALAGARGKEDRPFQHPHRLPDVPPR